MMSTNAARLNDCQANVAIWFVLNDGDDDDKDNKKNNIHLAPSVYISEN